MRRYSTNSGLVLTLFLLLGLNSFCQPFVEQTTISLPSATNGSVAWGDYDNDGYLDILVGNKVYKNNGNNTFSLTATIPIANYNQSVWADYDNDADLDILLASNDSTYIYTNSSGTFTKKGGIRLPGVNTGNFCLGDYDNDGDLDILYTGNDKFGNAFSKVFRNDITSFSEQTSIQLTQIANGQGAWADFDNDGDLDIILTGYSGITQAFSRIYENMGDDSFVERVNLQGSWRNALVCGDTDNDGDLDAITIGDGSRFLYQNNQNNNYSVIGLDTRIVAYGSVDLGDYDNDGDVDLLFTGNEYYQSRNVTLIYNNNGNNTFEEKPEYLFTGIGSGRAIWGDYDNDGDLDILLSGSSSSGSVTKIYRNDLTSPNASPSAPTLLNADISKANVTLSWDKVSDDITPAQSITYNVRVKDSFGNEKVNYQSNSNGSRQVVSMGNAQLDTTFFLRNLAVGTYYWKVQSIDNGFSASPFSAETSFSITEYSQSYNLTANNITGTTSLLKWRRGNGTGCLVFVKKGSSGTALPVNGTSYIPDVNFGSGSQIGSTGWYCVYSGVKDSVTVKNLQPVTDYSFQVCEVTAPTQYLTETTTNNPIVFTTNYFTLKTATTIPDLIAYSISWGDYNKDGYKDLLIAGDTGYFYKPCIRIFKNLGSGLFARQTIAIDQLNDAKAQWGDYDNDDDLDFLVTGSDQSNLLKTIIYRNNGSNVFEKMPISLSGISNGSVTWVDFDNDGDLDIAQAGSGNAGPVIQLFQNQRNNTFLEFNLPGMYQCVMKWADLDNDGDNDMVVSGYDINRVRTTKIYNNKGANLFEEVSNVTIDGVTDGSIDLGDFDNDGDFDILITGNVSEQYGAAPISKLYRNKGNFNFEYVASVNLKGVKTSSSVFGDYDNDGDLDILLAGMAGESPNTYSTTLLYRNNGDTTFTEQQMVVLKDETYGSLSWVDYDNDEDLDVFYAGHALTGDVTCLYRNDCTIANNKPNAPVGLSSTIGKGNALLKWHPVYSDNKALTYNLRIGTTSGKTDVLSSNSSASGYRYLADVGNAQFDTTYFIDKLLPGKYYWSVQSVDNTFSGGAFQTESNFTIDTVQASGLSARIVNSTTLTLKWLRGNGERCILFCKQGLADTAKPVKNKLYLADSQFGYGSQIGTSGWFCIYNGRNDTVQISGLNPNAYYQIQVIEYIGLNGSENYIRQLGNGSLGQFSTSKFSTYSETALDGGYDGSVSLVDFNNDGFLDVTVTGFGNSGSVANIYKNNGNNTFSNFTSITGGHLPLLTDRIIWGDYNNDNYLDFLQTGSTYSYLFTNQNGTFFQKETTIAMPGVSESSTSFSDFDCDGDLDLLFSGNKLSYPQYDAFTGVFKNLGGSFTLLPTPVLPQVFSGSCSWTDFDSDGDVDIMVDGKSNYFGAQLISSLYENKQSGNFTENNSYAFQSGYNNRLDWADYNNDGLIDALNCKGQVFIYKNLGNGVFTKLIPAGSISAENAAWADFNNDGLLDIIMTTSSATKILLNTPNGFTDMGTLGILGFSNSSLAVGDYDNDGDVDVIINGISNIGRVVRLFLNNKIMKAGQLQANNAPAIPVNLQSENIPAGTVLKWDPVKNDETPYQSMSYNVRIGTTKGNQDICPSNSAPDGFRLIPSLGNAFLDTTYIIRNLPYGKYYWSVQAVDQGYKGGAWSIVDSFAVKNTQAFFSYNVVCHGSATKLTDQSTSLSKITSRRWVYNGSTISTDSSAFFVFPNAGIDSIKLIVTDIDGLKDSVTHKISINLSPTAAFTAPSVCFGTATTFTNTTVVPVGLDVTWQWNFGDGGSNSIPTVKDPGGYTYLKVGTYNAILAVIGANGCNDTARVQVAVSPIPTASIFIASGSKFSFCKNSGDSASLSVAVQANCTYQWNSYGASLLGNTNSEITIKSDGGSYTATVTDTLGGCSVTTIVPVVIDVKESPAIPAIIYNALATTFCDGDSIRLTTGAVATSYTWLKGKGEAGSGSNSFVAKEAGTYRLLVGNTFGCTSTSNDSVVVKKNTKPEMPSISYGETNICSDGNVSFSVVNNPSYTYQWIRGAEDIPGGTLSLFNASKSGEYRLRVTNGNNCSVQTPPVAVSVTEKPGKPLIAEVSNNKLFCFGTPVELVVTNPSSIYDYQWLNYGVPTNEIKGKLRAGDYSVVIIYGSCRVESDILKLETKPAPAKPAIYAKGPNVWLLACDNTTAADYRWYYNDQLILGAKSNQYVANQNLGNYYVEVGDGGECYTSSDVINIPSGTIISEIDELTSNAITVHPNPTEGIFNADFGGMLPGKLQVGIEDASGKTIAQYTFYNSTGFSIDLSDYPSGIYFCKVIFRKSVVVKKIVKQ